MQKGTGYSGWTTPGATHQSPACHRYMDIGIQRDILGLKGQRVNQIKLDEQEQQLVIHCRRDKRRNAIDPVTGKKGTVNRYVRRQVRDVPLFG